MTHRLLILSLLFILSKTQADELPLLPPGAPAPLVRVFTGGGYIGTNRVDSGQSVTTTIRTPLTVSFEPGGMEVDGYWIDMTVLGRTRTFNLGTNTSHTIRFTNSPPAPSIDLRLLIPEQSVQIGLPIEPQRYFRTVVQTSTDLNGTNWQIYKALQQAVQK